MPRPFASGSRQAPDPYDQYLEQNGFYRKHTARDSSCLFRTISEQLYATQLHHLIIRQRCVDYMRKHKHLFQKNVDKDIDEYLDELSKPKTFGSLLELRAIAYLYRRNVILFEAYNTGTYMIKENYFANVFRVFFTPEKHFDTVFTSDFIEAAAFCQGICYEILYKHVFKLPDVMYAVEQMLHGSSLEFIKSKTHYFGPYAKRVVYADGREFELNTPEETNCILDSNVLCHFHNPNFPQFADNLHHDMHFIEASQYDNQKITKTLDSLLPEKYISCVQQLLKDGITPFPYKVAKALDPDIYRNVEFDAWSEMRKEQRFKNWYMGGSNLQVGVKCLVKLGSSQSSLYNCHIQDMSPEKGPCLVYIEELAEKHTVPYESLQPLPSDLAKPWPLPFRYQKHIERSPEKPNETNEIRKYRKISSKGRFRELIVNNCSVKKEVLTEDEISSEKDEVSYQLKQFTSIQHYCPPPYEVLAMPFNVDSCSNNDNARPSRRNSTHSAASHLTSGTDIVKRETKKEDDNDVGYNESDQFPAYTYEGYPDSYYAYSYEGGIVHPGSTNPLYCMYNGHQYATPPGAVVPHGIFIQPTIPCSQQAAPGAYYPNAAVATLPSPPFLPTGATSSSTASTTNICRHHNGMLSTVSTITGRVNFSANRSIIPTGDDLPCDVPTLRFFFNLGCEYYKQMQKSTADLGQASDKVDITSKLANGLQSSLKLDRDDNSTSKSDISAPAHNTTHQNSKRFSSRYFNSKKSDKQMFRNSNGSVNNPHRSSQSEMNGKQPGASKSNSTMVVSATSSSNANSKVFVNHATAVTTASSEQTIQTSPTSALNTTETWSNDFTHGVPLYGAQAGPLPYSGPCIPIYTDNESQQGVFVQPPPTFMTVPYGMYPFPQGPHPAANFPTYLPPPPSTAMPVAPAPTFVNNPFIAAAGGGDASQAVSSDAADSTGSYSIMSFPPVYYSPTANGGGMAGNSGMQPGYWYPAAPSFPTSNQSSVTNNITSTSSSTSIPSR